MKVISKDGSVKEYGFEEAEGREAFRHTAAHILAQAVKRLYPRSKCAIGPAIEDGFYHDFEFDFEFTVERLEEIEQEMKRIVKEALPLRRFSLGRSEAACLMEHRGEPYKTELIYGLAEEESLTFFEQGEYVDICAGPHISNTGLVKAFKLTSAAGAYWKGSEQNKMLTRIYGTAFPKSSDLEDYLQRVEETARRDHRRLGKDMGLFAFMEDGQGFPFFLPNGLVLKNLLIDYWRQIHMREGYQEIETPLLLNRGLWETSGHWEHYKDNMYSTVIDHTDYVVKPMNCPGGMLVYKMRPRSYRELPIRLGELGLVHRHEKSGTLHGLMRARCFTQDDAHIFMEQHQVTEEIKKVIRLIDEVYSRFGFLYHVELSTRPQDSIGSDEDWELAEEGLKKALAELQLPYKVNAGDGAFYGPKIDFHLEDSIGRTWQCGTVQLDFQLPQRFQAEYTWADGEKHRPVMIHRVVFGLIERFIGILIEHYAGKFPVWLAPVQVKILPISDLFAGYAESVMDIFTLQGIRCGMDKRDEKIGYKIREAQLDKVPYMVIIGQKEADGASVSVRSLEDGNLGSMRAEEFIKRIKA